MTALEQYLRDIDATWRLFPFVRIVDLRQRDVKITLTWLANIPLIAIICRIVQRDHVNVTVLSL
jgi:hypothetical protein